MRIVAYGPTSRAVGRSILIKKKKKWTFDDFHIYLTGRSSDARVLFR